MKSEERQIVIVILIVILTERSDIFQWSLAKIAKNAKRPCWRHNLAITPKALYSRAQCREEHAGLLINQVD